MRIHELAKKLDIPSKELISKLRSLGIEAKSHMSAVSDEDEAKALQALAPTAVAESAPVEATAEIVVAEAAEPEPPAIEEPAAEEPPALIETEAEPAPEEAEEADDKNIIVKGPVVVRDFAEMLNETEPGHRRVDGDERVRVDQRESRHQDCPAACDQTWIYP